MANPQPDKYFKYSIEYFEALCKVRINGEARQMLDVIIRQTWGYHRKSAEIPTDLFIKLTGLARQAVHKARKKLLDMNLISVTQKGNSQIKTYCIQKDYEKWQVLPKKVTVRHQKGNSPLPKKVTVRHQKGNSPLPKKVTVSAETTNNDNSSQDPKDNIKDNIKDILEAKRRSVTQKGNSKTNNIKKGNTKDLLNPSIKIFIDFAFIEYKKVYGDPLLIDGGKDGEIIKKLLGTFTLERLKELWVEFLNFENDFLGKAGHSIGIFKTQINKLTSKKKRNIKEQDENSLAFLRSKIKVTEQEIKMHVPAFRKKNPQYEEFSEKSLIIGGFIEHDLLREKRNKENCV